jgi:hypothetical protein
MTEGEFYEKFESNAARTLSRTGLDAVWAVGLRFNALAHVSELTRHLSKS